MILSGAMKAAVRAGLVVRNVAVLVNGKPKAPQGHGEEVERHCWSADEAMAFLDAAKAAGDQPAALYALALETGMRKSELGGLKWTDVDLGKGLVRIQRQIVVRSGEPFTFGPVKNKKPRAVHVTSALVALLRRHKAHQAELKLQSGGRYHDHGLVFAKEWIDEQRKRDTLGDPLSLNNIGQREFARLIKAADVRPIKFHGMRHTSATLALQAGQSPKVVQERLGHQKITTTLDIYAHVLPAHDQAAADAIGGLIHGKR
jgi:integrase